MFGKPVQDVTFEDVTLVLESGVREGISLDFKRDFPTHLEKTLAAFANTYGGYVLIGVDETETGAAVTPPMGVELKPGLRERVVQKALDAIYPPLLPDVRVIEFRSNSTLPAPDRALLVIHVAESTDAPHSVEDKTAVYLRSDNISTREIRRASIGEIEWLINKRRRSVELRNVLIANAADRATRLRSHRHEKPPIYRYWRDGEMTLVIAPAFPRQPLLEIRRWVEAVEASRVEIRSAPRSIPNGRKQLVSGGVSFESESSYSEYQVQGILFHEFDYWWDYIPEGKSQQRRQLFPNATAALFSSVLANATSLYQRSMYRGSLQFSFVATGLDNAFFKNHDPIWGVGDSPALTESEVRLSREFTMDQLESSQAEIAMDCQRELYWAFGIDASEAQLRFDFSHG